MIPGGRKAEPGTTAPVVSIRQLALAPWIVVGIANSVTTPEGGDAPDLVGAIFGEPQVAVRPRRDASRAAEGRWDRVFGNHSGGGDPADVVDAGLVGARFDEPQRAVRPCGDALGQAHCGRD